jgi:hypothetical protein
MLRGLFPLTGFPATLPTLTSEGTHLRRIAHATVLLLFLLASTGCSLDDGGGSAPAIPVTASPVISLRGDGCDLTFAGSDRKAVKLRPANLDYTFLNGGRPVSLSDFFVAVCPLGERVPTRWGDIPQDEALPEERLKVKLRGFVMAMKREDDNDLHVQVADRPEPFDQEQVVVEIPPGAEYCDARAAIMGLFRADGGTNVRRRHIFSKPPQVDVTGYLFLDAAHMRARRTDFCTDNGGRGIRDGRGASPVRGIWELHPVVKLEVVGDVPRGPSPSSTLTPPLAAKAPNQEQGDPNVRVWINTNSGVYHCPGTRWYGRTKEGVFMTQQEALEKGNRPAYGNVCR